MERFGTIRGNLIFHFWRGSFCSFFLIVVLVSSQGVTGKTTTTDDTLIYENDPGNNKVTLRPPGPSIFEYSFSSSPTSDLDSKVKRANVHPRYYELVEDEMYVFEPSDLGMSPFMEAMQSDYNRNNNNNNPVQQIQPQPNRPGVKAQSPAATPVADNPPQISYQYQQTGPHYNDLRLTYHHEEDYRNINNDNYNNYNPHHQQHQQQPHPQYDVNEHSSNRQNQNNHYNPNRPPPYFPESQQGNHNSGISNGRPSPAPQNLQSGIPLFQKEDIPVIQEIPILIPHSADAQQVIPPQLESPPQLIHNNNNNNDNRHFSSPPPSQKYPDNSQRNSPHVSSSPSLTTTNSPGSFHSTSQPHENNLVVPRHGPQCITSNDKDGQCISFRRCYPVVFNSLDGQLRDPGLAKILFQAAGSCDPTHENADNVQAKQKVIPGIIDNDPNIPPDFFNHSICCATFYLSNSNNRFETGHSSEPKTMRPSPPDPRKSPPEFQHEQQSTTQQSQGAASLEPEFDIEDSSSDYYGDEYSENADEPEDDYLYTSTEIPKLIPKKVKKVKGNNSTESSDKKNKSVSEVEENKDKASSSNKTQDQSESIQKEVKVEGTGKGIIKVTKKKVKKIRPVDIAKVEREVQKGEGEISNDSPISSSLNPSKPREHIPFVIEAPELLSAWECPGRKIGMPRGHWPWMVALLNDGNHFCSGSLIDHKHILTSSSCVAPFQGKDIGRLRVILGDRVLYSSVDGPHVWRGVVRIARHLQFDPVTMQNDIAIIEMDHAVGYSRTVQPINLASSSNHSHVSRGIVSGWSGADIGKRRFFAPRSTIDSVAQLIDPQECSKDYNGFLGHPDISTRNLICTKPTKASCMADPGSPLMIKTNNCWHIIGILSHGLRCGSFPDLFTDTAKFLPWIHKNIRQKPLA